MERGISFPLLLFSVCCNVRPTDRSLSVAYAAPNTTHPSLCRPRIKECGGGGGGGGVGRSFRADGGPKRIFFFLLLLFLLPPSFLCRQQGEKMFLLLPGKRCQSNRGARDTTDCVGQDWRRRRRKQTHFFTAFLLYFSGCNYCVPEIQYGIKQLFLSRDRGSLSLRSMIISEINLRGAFSLERGWFIV